MPVVTKAMVKNQCGSQTKQSLIKYALYPKSLLLNHA